MTVTTYGGRTFDAVPLLDPANLPYRLTAPANADDLLGRSKFWTAGATLDQGEEGACVPHGVVGEALASPVRVKPADPQALAFAGYDWCRRNDVFPGENYDGTDSNTGMKWGRLQGWWTGWRWAMNMVELRTGLEEGPVCVATEWHSGMYEAPGGVLTVSGRMVGWHFYLVTGWSAWRQAYRVKNSWGNGWGVRGQAYIKPDDLDRILFRAGGEAAVPVGRRLA